jgi:glutamate dehydrogenase
MRVMGICDGSCVVSDPAGLVMTELLCLVHESLMLSCFDAAKLSATGFFHDVSTLVGVRARNLVHNRVKSDQLIRVGGRPITTYENNCREFVADAQGNVNPSSPLIVEGANLFMTPEAPAALRRGRRGYRQEQLG